MKTNIDLNKVIYFAAAGVLALGLQSQYRQGSFPALHRVAEQADCFMSRVAVNAERTLVAGPGSSPSSFAFRRSLAAQSLAISTAAKTTASGVSRMQAEMISEKALNQAECVRDTIREKDRAQAEVRRAVYQMQHELQRSRTRARVRVERAWD